MAAEELRYLRKLKRLKPRKCDYFTGLTTMGRKASMGIYELSFDVGVNGYENPRLIVRERLSGLIGVRLRPDETYPLSSEDFEKLLKTVTAPESDETVLQKLDEYVTLRRNYNSRKFSFLRQ